MRAGIVVALVGLALGCGGIGTTSGHASQTQTNRPPDPPDPPPVTAAGLDVEVSFVGVDYIVRAVDERGEILATDYSHGTPTLFASADGGRSWSRRGTAPVGGFRIVASLPSGTLLADLATPAGDLVARSADFGASWTTVLPLGAYRLLQPHNVTTLGHTVFLGEYQTFAKVAPVHLWASDDDGRTWSLRHEFDGRRHCHGLVADEQTGALWALFGDTTGGVLRSTDGGLTFTEIQPAPDGVAVDAILSGDGLLFGRDALSAPSVPAIEALGLDGTVTVVASLPGPSYSIQRAPKGGFLAGETRETDGDVYAADDVSAHLFGSADGAKWEEIASFPRLTSSAYARADVYWRLPTGEVVLSLENVKGLGTTGSGFELLDVTPH